MKGQRLLKIREIISENVIETQEELVDALRDAGFAVTQATISRDIKEMHLIKTPTADGKYKYSLPTAPSSYQPDVKLHRLLNDVFVAIDFAENLVVMRTLPGNAHAVAVLFDTLDWPEILGTVAGDDTILLIARSKDNASFIVERIKSLL
ncbi:transcriptional regulator AhrC/ArgR [Sulfoacidibacillus thermotolerans]|uniref:Arginine repressor n=1 Tax=Sulfoacidibacillus thermotolerans TaxID=1765684 RepID=A0A2U3DBZ2_SULT2|nr:transcriptional regulator ArgR [Sulfoacidibacillus thermotolerans]PWI58775.1 arginine repressor [Sulfoacidibacillus thermotolerans]